MKKLLLYCFLIPLFLFSALAADYSSNDKVYRGGLCTEELFRNASGVTIDAKGKMQGVSVNIAPGKTDKIATENMPHKKIGVSTVGAIIKAGGKVVSSPTKSNPYHALLSGISPSEAEAIFKLSLILNPNVCKKERP